MHVTHIELWRGYSDNVLLPLLMLVDLTMEIARGLVGGMHGYCGEKKHRPLGHLEL